MNTQQFRSNSKDVLELRRFFETPLGQRFAAAIRSEHPLAKLTTHEAGKPGLVRGLSKAEGESAEVLLGKITGYEMALKCFEELMSPIPDRSTPASRRGGKQIAPESL